MLRLYRERYTGFDVRHESGKNLGVSRSFSLTIAAGVAAKIAVEHGRARMEQVRVQRICCFLHIRWLMTWFTVDSTCAVATRSPRR